MARHRRAFRSLRTSRRGLTLIELMVTIVLLAIGLVGVASMFLHGYRTQVNAHFASVAADEAAKKLERMRAAGFNGISSTLFPPTFTVAELPAGAGTIEFSPYPDADSTNQYRVRVTITWGGGPGVSGRVALNSVISNHG